MTVKGDRILIGLWCHAQVMRQWAIAAGHGRRRPRPKKESKAKLGTEGEDTATDAEGNLILRLPARFGPTTVKGAAWQVSFRNLLCFSECSRILVSIWKAMRATKHALKMSSHTRLQRWFAVCFCSAIAAF